MALSRVSPNARGTVLPTYTPLITPTSELSYKRGELQCFV